MKPFLFVFISVTYADIQTNKNSIIIRQIRLIR